MGRISLVRDERKGLFALPVMIIRNEVPQASHDGDAIENFTMYVDTGSGISSVGQDVAERLGISTRNPQRRGIYGAGGFKNMPVIRDLRIWVLEPVAGPVPINLKEATIMEDAEESETTSSGGFRRRVRRRGSGVSIFGLDALNSLRATLTVRVHENFGQLEW